MMKWALSILVLLTLAGLVVFAVRPRAVPVDFGRVSVAPLRVSVEQEGRTRIKERYVVSSPLTGRLRRITLDPGDRVQANSTTLAVIEPTDPSLLDARSLAEAEGRARAAEAGVRQAQARLESSRAAYDLAESNRTRIENAFEQRAANKAEIERARADERRTMEEYRAAQFGQEIAEYELEVARSAMLVARGDAQGGDQYRLTLASPIDGAVLRVFQESVAVVAPGTPLIEIGDPQDLEIVIDVLSSDGVGIRPGQRVIIRQWGGDEDLEAVVRLVEPSAFTKVSALGIEEQRVNVIADFVSPPDQRPTLGDAFRVEASIVTWEQDQTLQVPASALFRQGEGWAVFRTQNGRARMRVVAIGRRNSLAAQVLSGLEDGDQVVLYPNDRITDGRRVSERTPH